MKNSPISFSHCFIYLTIYVLYAIIYLNLKPQIMTAPFKNLPHFRLDTILFAFMGTFSVVLLISHIITDIESHGRCFYFDMASLAVGLSLLILAKGTNNYTKATGVLVAVNSEEMGKPLFWFWTGMVGLLSSIVLWLTTGWMMNH